MSTLRDNSLAILRIYNPHGNRRKVRNHFGRASIVSVALAKQGTEFLYVIRRTPLIARQVWKIDFYLESKTSYATVTKNTLSSATMVHVHNSSHYESTFSPMCTVRRQCQWRFLCRARFWITPVEETRGFFSDARIPVRNGPDGLAWPHDRSTRRTWQCFFSQRRYGYFHFPSSVPRDHVNSSKRCAWILSPTEFRSSKPNIREVRKELASISSQGAADGEKMANT